MDETPRQRLARLMTGAPANSSPMPNFAVGANPNMPPMPNFAARAPVPASEMPNFAAPGSSSAYLPPMRLPQPTQPQADPYAFLPPYTGLRNSQTLPPFEQPGGSLPMDRYMQPPPQAPAAPQPQYAAPMPQQPMQVQSGGQGYAGPDPMLPPPYDPMTDPRYLPEQWRGSFTGGQS
jgi:hypothetical protein|tara:strand:- start:132 stop:662 length:531 start_codon:yes stop_codon:yes gene_type:complete